MENHKTPVSTSRRKKYYLKHKDRILKTQRQKYKDNYNGVKDKKKLWLKNNKHLIKKYTEKSYIRIHEKKIQLKKELVDYKGGKCQKCGYNKCITALEFHHNNGNKDTDIAKMIVYMLDIAVLKKEADKCELLCANCHREEHFAEEEEKWQKRKKKLNVN